MLLTLFLSLYFQGRFCDTYEEIKTLLMSDELLPPKRLGSIVCVAMIDCSPHAKARVLACHTCLSCVEKTGLSGVGKKGVLSTAKLLSQETTKYRGPPLELMEMILSKMNGDIQRLVRICGPSLSDKAKQLLEERRHKRGAQDGVTSTSNTLGTPGRRSRGSTQQEQTSGSRRQPKKSDIYDELPRLSLRAGVKDASKSSPRYREESQDDNADDPFAFSIAALRSASPTSTKSESNVPTSAETSGGGEILSVKSADIEPSGAAALLRARLQKLREKGKSSEENAAADNIGQTQAQFGSGADGVANDDAIDYDSKMECVRNLLNRDGPILDCDPDVEASIGVLRLFHSALSGQHHPALGMTPSQFSSLRTFLIENTNAVVDLLTRYVQSNWPCCVKRPMLPFLPVCV